MKPMLAKPRAELPVGDYLYEPKWDGSRCLIFREGDSLQLQSRNEKPLNRYFPELVESMRRLLPKRCAVDGEIVIAGPEGLDFEALLQRVHPAASRVAKLSKEFPASFVAFDVLKPRRPGLFGEAVRRAESAPGKDIQSEGCALVVAEHSRSNAGALVVYWV